MRIVDANTLVGSTVEGVRGSLTVMPGFDEGDMGAQLVIVPPNTKAPKPGKRLESRTLVFVLQGSATLSNGEYYQKVTPGKMVLLEGGEERTFQTEKDKFVCLEVRIGAGPPPAPEPVPSIVFTAPPAPEPAPTKSAAMYEEV